MKLIELVQLTKKINKDPKFKIGEVILVDNSDYKKANGKIAVIDSVTTNSNHNYIYMLSFLRDDLSSGYETYGYFKEFEIIRSS